MMFFFFFRARTASCIGHNRLKILTYDLVNGVVVLELDEGEAAHLAGVLVDGHVDGNNFAIGLQLK